MNRLFIIPICILSFVLCSCGFLLSPVGKELVEDSAQEIIKIEDQITAPLPITTKTPTQPKIQTNEKTDKK